jgi:stage II sporulation protein D (peptidoglycan lytic transglycosylase)
LAITGVDRSRGRSRLCSYLGAAAALGLIHFVMLWSCAPASPPGAPPAPEVAAPSGEPEVRIGLAVGAGSAALGGAGPLSVSDASGSRLAEIPAGEVWRLSVSGTGLVVNGPGGFASAPANALTILSGTSGEPVRVDARGYHGTIQVLRDRTGLTVVNRVRLESYILGVVSAEMGRRSSADQEALRAQAVVSRTYALRNLRRWGAQGFDLYATVADQVYGGIGTETPEALDAVGATKGQILTFGGAPIDAFFYSTCGGRTAEGTEVFRAADRPYLRSVADVGDNGVAYCSISPRFRWHEEWSGESLRAILARTLPLTVGVPAEAVQAVSDVRISYRTGSGRVGQLTIALPRSEVRIEGPMVRQVLRPRSGDLLRSNAFSLIVSRAGGRVTRLVAEGEGSGHGVGFCQWGAVGRSRAGQDYRHILAAYYPGASLERLY